MRNEIRGLECVTLVLLHSVNIMCYFVSLTAIPP